MSRSSLIELGKRFYSVPSRLIREWVEVDVHADHLAVHHGGKLTATMPRIHGAATARVDYRHIIWSLVQKPGAFANYRYREELFPSLIFRRTYDAFTQWHGRGADLAYLRVLHLAASTMESMVAAALDDLLARDEHFTYEAVKARVSPERPVLPVVTIDAPDLRAYDQLLTAEAS